MKSGVLFARRAAELLGLLLIATAVVHAHESGDQDHAVVLEFGAAGEKPITGGASNFGGTLGAEVTPIENWLEIEFGLAALSTAGRTELSTDLLFKKPYQLSRTVELMVGAGPSLSKTLNGVDRGTSLGVEVALDFMIWPFRKFGWYVEPTWGIVPKSGEQTVGISVGVLIGVP